MVFFSDRKFRPLKKYKENEEIKRKKERILQKIRFVRQEDVINIIYIYMNDVLIKNEHTLSEYTCPKLSDNFCLDNSSCGFCSDVICYDTCKNFSFDDFSGEVKKSTDAVVQNINDKNYKQLYKKNSLRKYLMGGISEESVILPNNSDNDCLICYDRKGTKPFVVCSLCSKFVHYKCYKKFTEKNNYYTMKCIQCDTRSLQFSKKWWQSWCCFN